MVVESDEKVLSRFPERPVSNADIVGVSRGGESGNEMVDKLEVLSALSLLCHQDNIEGLHE